MDWPRWRPLYEEILRDFGFSREADEAGRDLLATLVGASDVSALSVAIAGRDAVVVGPRLSGEPLLPGAVVLAADSAIPRLVARGVRPDVIVTDLDGDVALQVAANRDGAIAVVHAHGDNLDALREWAPWFSGRVVATCQCEPRGAVRNFGGFTDGDRACFIADHFGARSIALVGFDFENPEAKPGRDPEVKRRKLAWARRLIESVAPSALF